MTTMEAGEPTTGAHAKWHVPLPRVARWVLSRDVRGTGINNFATRDPAGVPVPDQ